MNNSSFEAPRLVGPDDLGDISYIGEGSLSSVESKERSGKFVFPLFNIQIGDEQHTVGIGTDPLSFGIPSVDSTKEVSSSSEYPVSKVNTVSLPEGVGEDILGVRLINGDTLKIIPTLKDDKGTHEILLHEDERVSYFKPLIDEPERSESELRVSLYDFIKSLSEISSIKVPEPDESLSGFPTDRKIEELYYTFLNVSDEESILLLFDDVHLPSISWFKQFHSESFGRELSRTFNTLEHRSNLNESVEEDTEGFLRRLQRRAQIAAETIWGFDFNIDERGVNLERPPSLPHIAIESASIEEIRQYYKDLLELLYDDMEEQDASKPLESTKPPESPEPSRESKEGFLFIKEGISFREVTRFDAGSEIKGVKNGLVHLKQPDGESLEYITENGTIRNLVGVMRGWKGSHLLSCDSKRARLWNSNKGMISFYRGRWNYDFELPPSSIQRVIDADVGSDGSPVFLVQMDKNYSSVKCLIEDFKKYSSRKLSDIKVDQNYSRLTHLFDRRYFLHGYDGRDGVYERKEDTLVSVNMSSELRRKFRAQSISNIGGFFAVSGVKEREESNSEKFVVNLCSADLRHITVQLEMDIVPTGRERKYDCKMVVNDTNSQVYGLLHPKSGGIEDAAFFTFDFQPFIERGSTKTIERKLSDSSRLPESHIYKIKVVKFLDMAGILNRFNAGHPISSYNIEHIEGNRVRLYIGRGVIDLEH